jgi:hypothetical protein
MARFIACKQPFPRLSPSMVIDKAIKWAQRGAKRSHSDIGTRRRTGIGVRRVAGGCDMGAKTEAKRREGS